MEENLKARLVLQIRALRFSQSDMKQARLAAEVIPSYQGEIRRLLETALVVTYARPFTDGLAMDRRKWGPKDAGEQKIHKRLIELRNELYAHTDDTVYRDVVDTAKMLGREEHSYAERWTEMQDQNMALVAQMAEGQRERFKAAADKLEERLQAASMTPPRPAPLFHRSLDAEAILAHGFVDSATVAVDGETVTGVWFADEPHRESSRPAFPRIFRVEIARTWGRVTRHS